MNQKQKQTALLLLVCTLLITSFFTQTSALRQPQDNMEAYPLYMSPQAGYSTPVGYSPSQMRTAYNLPSSGGAGTTIAIIDAYDAPNITSDLTGFCNQYGLPLPNESNFEVHKMAPSISVDEGWAKETTLDVEWAHAIAPDAKILLVEAVSSFTTDLRSAVTYARNRPDVVAVSISWGSSEYSREIYDDSVFTSAYGAVFFVSSGDNGSDAILWPATSPNVVAVGGTSLNLNPDGSVISETAWSRSGGGVSAYQPRPSYQTSYGLTNPKRTIPDVSYNGDPQTGVSVYFNGAWYRIGGTSAGAPQWAAIQALGRSATNVNLYQKADLAYSSYYRDISEGSNGVYSAGPNYDYVTGLGSPLTINYVSTVSVSPASGSAGAPITVNGDGFTPDNTVSLSYLNPLSNVWSTLPDNISTTSSGTFAVSLNAPDLKQNNPVNDTSGLSDSIKFSAVDHGNGFSVATVTPYTEYRRGLTTIGNFSATGLFGNSTNFASRIYAQTQVPLAISGRWFNPGTATFLCDNSIPVGSATVSAAGEFTATISLPPSVSIGQHAITLNDGSANFALTITRSPAVNASYDGAWQNSNFTVALNPEAANVSTFYRLNRQATQETSVNGQPLITAEGAGNTLEYWGIWNNSGATIELPHQTLGAIKLDKAPPQGALTINDGATTTTSLTVALQLTATDALSGLKQIRFSDSIDFSGAQWETPANSRSWQLPGGYGAKTVYCQIQDNAGLTTTINASIMLVATLAIPQQQNSQPQNTEPSSQPSSNPDAVPEYPTVAPYIVLLAAVTLVLACARRKRSIP